MAVDGFVIHKKRIWSLEPWLNPSYSALRVELRAGHLNFQKLSFHICQMDIIMPSLQAHCEDNYTGKIHGIPPVP